MKRLLAFIFAALLALSLVSCGKEIKNPYGLDLCKEVTVGDQSYFSDAIVSADGKTVQYICIVTLESADEKQHSVRIYGDFLKEYEAGLVADDTVYGTYAGKDKIQVPEAGLPLIKVIFTVNLPEDYKEGDEVKLDDGLPDMYVVNG